MKQRKKDNPTYIATNKEAEIQAQKVDNLFVYNDITR